MGCTPLRARAMGILDLPRCNVACYPSVELRQTQKRRSPLAFCTLCEDSISCPTRAP
jgi:hypothetical protein